MVYGIVSSVEYSIGEADIVLGPSRDSPATVWYLLRISESIEVWVELGTEGSLCSGNVWGEWESK